MGENINLDNFVRDFKRINSNIEMESAELIYLTDDNSFPDFLISFCRYLGNDIENAIKEQEFVKKEVERIESMFCRYIDVITNNIAIKIINTSLTESLKNTNILFYNWFRLVRDSNLYEEFKITKEKVDDFEQKLRSIDEILSGAINLEKLIWMTNSLITKAKEVLSSVPPSFNISEHYAKAVREALGD